MLRINGTPPICVRGLSPESLHCTFYGIRADGNASTGVPYSTVQPSVLCERSSQGCSDMPKMKSHSGAKKRFKKTGNGKVKRKKANKGHLLTKKNQKRKRQLRKSVVVEDKANRDRIKRMLST